MSTNKIIAKTLGADYLKEIITTLEELKTKIGVIAEQWDGYSSGVEETNMDYAFDVDIHIDELIDMLKGEYDFKNYQI